MEYVVNMQKDEYDEVETDPYSEEEDEEEQHKPKLPHEILQDLLNKKKKSDRVYLIEVTEG